YIHVEISAPILLTSTNETPYGIYETIASGDSNPSTSGMGSGNYPPNENPSNAFDSNVTTKYLNFGTDEVEWGLNTGLYLTLQRGTSIAMGLRFSTANDFPNRDPLFVTLEGSNQSNASLNLGSSWTLIYSGSSGLATDPGRYSWGEIQWFSNSIPYASYRLLITQKRGSENSVQYSGFQLYGYPRLVPQLHLKIIQNTTTNGLESSVPVTCTTSITTSSVIVEYVTHILSKCNDNDILNPIMVGLGLMTQTEEFYNSDSIQSIFTAVLPLLAEYIIQNRNTEQHTDNSNLHYVYWLLCKMTGVMIAGPQQNSLEMEHTEKAC
ncbi:unnamed protein product, partial [Rotaria sp. Silwood1]